MTAPIATGLLDVRWAQMAQNFAATTPGAEYVQQSVEDIADPAFLAEIAATSTADTTVHSIHLSRAAFRRHSVFDPTFLLEGIQQRFGNRLVLTSKEGDLLKWNLPTLSWARDAANVAFDYPNQEPIDWVLVSGAIERDTINEFHRWNLHQIGLSASPLYLADADVIVEPLPFGIHELYHGIDFARYHVWARQMAVHCYDAIGAMELSADLAIVGDQILDNLTDLEAGSASLDSLLGYLWSPLRYSSSQLLSLGHKDPDIDAKRAAYGSFTQSLLDYVCPRTEEMVARSLRAHLNPWADWA